jgi:glyoxylase-like metal-dependent hydrolase (beta-lactamase superfamily II)
MIGGDHLLPEISSNPVLSRDFLTQAKEGEPLARYRSLPAYLDSMRATRDMAITKVLPGHGPVFEGHAELIDSRFASHDKRADKMLSALDAGPANALQVAQAIWGEVAAAQPFLTFSEVLGHMDVLAEEGQVEETLSADGDSWLFERT